MHGRFWQFRIGVFAALAALASVAAGRADASPLLWSDQVSGEAIRVFTDGERAIGGGHGNSLYGPMEVTLLGLKKGGGYAGKLSGRLSGRGRDQAVTGSWTLNPQQNSKQLVVEITNRDGQKLHGENVALARPEPPTPLRCGWARGSVTRQRNGRPSPMGMGDAIAVGDTVTTGPAGVAILVLEDRSVAVTHDPTTPPL